MRRCSAREPQSARYSTEIRLSNGVSSSFCSILMPLKANFMPHTSHCVGGVRAHQPHMHTKAAPEPPPMGVIKNIAFFLSSILIIFLGDEEEKIPSHYSKMTLDGKCSNQFDWNKSPNHLQRFVERVSNFRLDYRDLHLSFLSSSCCPPSIIFIVIEYVFYGNGDRCAMRDERRRHLSGSCSPTRRLHHQLLIRQASGLISFIKLSFIASLFVWLFFLFLRRTYTNKTSHIGVYAYRWWTVHSSTSFSLWFCTGNVADSVYVCAIVAARCVREKWYMYIYCSSGMRLLPWTSSSHTMRT